MFVTEQFWSTINFNINALKMNPFSKVINITLIVKSPNTCNSMSEIYFSPRSDFSSITS